MCEELDHLKRAMVSAFSEARRLRMSRDVSIHEDAQLSCETRDKADEVIKHLLSGHEGKPCPSAECPIVSARPPRPVPFRIRSRRATA
ncbi:MAG TPA: hypothetical protein VMJ93_18690 [Verrucomicrobiae bacterium]|nr:hypothetical protein [Verrucomicrobiae bacterium]